MAADYGLMLKVQNEENKGAVTVISLVAWWFWELEGDARTQQWSIAIAWSQVPKFNIGPYPDRAEKDPYKTLASCCQSVDSIELNRPHTVYNSRYVSDSGYKGR